MHQSADEDPKSNGPNGSRGSGPSPGSNPLHRVAADANLDLSALWLSHRPDDVACHQVSATYSYERGYQRRVRSVKFPGCYAN